MALLIAGSCSFQGSALEWKLDSRLCLDTEILFIEAI